MSKRVALAIGNAEYMTIARLGNPKNDARLIGEVMDELGFDLLQCATGDKYFADADYITMRRALADFSEKADNADIAFVYFAGHGVQLDGENYLIPTDAGAEKVRRLYFETVSLFSIRKAISGAKLSFIALDACRANPFPVGMRGVADLAPNFAGVQEMPNQIVFFASLAGHMAQDGASGGNSPFAESLARQLREDKEIREVIRDTEGDVASKTEKSQNPSSVGNTTGQTWYFHKSEPENITSKLVKPSAINMKLHNNKITKVVPGSGTIIKDEIGPEMVVVPAGRCTIGLDEKKEVILASPFAVSRFPVTVAQWRIAQDDPKWQVYSGVAPKHPKLKFLDDDMPMTCVDWHDATAYARWLSRRSGKEYRLPSEVEWEFACRCFSKTDFWWGEKPFSDFANYGQPFDGVMRPVESYKPNPWGLFQMHGNTWEWVADVWLRDITRLSADGTANQEGDAKMGVLRGGGMHSSADEIKSGHRKEAVREIFDHDRGFRVVRQDLTK